MIETADSKINSKNCVIIKIHIKDIINDGPVLPRRVINKWPAIILAVSRTARVPGRITFLIVSINTIKGIKTLGVPWGIKWQNIWLVLMIQPYSIKLIHKGRLRVSVNVKWLELVKIYGNKPKKLLNKIIANKLIKIKVLPLNPLFPNSVLNSLCSVIIIIFHKNINREGINQNDTGIIKNPINVLNQFNENEKIEVDGSNTENKFIIIFNLNMRF